MKELKIGDIIEVFVDKIWEDRIFLKCGEDRSIICVSEMSNSGYLSGNVFVSCKWYFGKWRVKEELEYIPFTYEDRAELRGRYIIKKEDSDTEYIINKIEKNGIHTIYNYINLEKLLEDYTFADTGKPCGKIKE